MRFNNIFKCALGALLLAGFAACSNKEFDEITEMDLNRCLEPMNLAARVSSSLGDVVTFSWDVSKDADSYEFVVYTDEALTQTYLSETLSPSQVPYQKKLVADNTFYFTVQARAEGKQDSHVASYTKAIKTFAVKDNLYLKLADRTATSVTLSWSTEVSDFEEVDRIEYSLPGEDALGTHTLTAAEIAAGSAVVDGLTASTEYEFTLYYLSASRGQINTWTAPDVSVLTEVSSLAALQNAMATSGARIYLKLEGSPYDIEAMDISNGFTLIGEEDVDGSKPVIQGEFHIADNYDGSDLWFEAVELNGGATATSPSGFGFAIQKKNGGTSDNLKIGNITYKNCIITGFSKGLIYEWSKSFVAGDVIYDSCDINNINSDGTGGGDVFDIRQASTLNSVQFINNTIYQGMRTFVRFDQATVGNLVFENNTLQNLCFVDNANNAGIFGINAASTIGGFSFKNNLFLNMTGKATLAGSNTKYAPASDLNVAASGNYFYNLPVGDDGAISYFTDNFTLANANGTILDSDPCYNAPGGYFNLLSDSEIAGKGIGASKWWTSFVEEPEDLTLGLVEGNKTWNLGNAKYFSGTIKNQRVRDLLFISASESTPIVVENSMLNFQEAVVTNKAGVPSVNYVAFKVDGPGSVVIKAADAEGLGNHLVVATGDVDGTSVAVKGGVSAMADMTTATKILITSIPEGEETLVYVYPSGPVSLEKLAWSTDVTPVNTALPTPAPAADPKSITAGDATDITVSWEPVAGAASYSVVFNGKTSTVSDGTEYVIGGTTTGMLDAGSYTVEVYANPGADDIYNTESAAGVAAFAVLPKASGGDDGAFIVTSAEQLLAAIAAGKEEITLAAGEYDLGGQLTVSDPVTLIGQSGAVVTGGFKLSGNVGTFALESLTVKAGGQGNFIEFDNSEGLTADLVYVKDVVIDGFGKSVIYASNTADKFNVSDIIFDGAEVYNHGTGQGVFDLRNGNYGTFTLANSTISGGRDFLRVDAPCAINAVYVRNNTGYNLNDSGNAGGILCVRATPAVYTVTSNIFANILNSVSGRAAAMKPVMKGNVWYNIGEKFYTGCIDAELAVDGNGFVLEADPFKDAAANDFTLTNGVVMSVKAGAPKWNPYYDQAISGNAITVTTADEFYAAVAAGKTEIIFAAGNYDLSAEAFTLTAGMKLSGEDGAELKVNQFNLAEGELGSLTIENLKIVGDDNNNFINVGNASVVRSLTVRNCDISHVKKSLFYGNADGSSFQSLVFNNIVASELGGGQGTFDIRKGEYVNVTIEQSTIIGGRDFIRADAGKVTGAVSVVNNVFDGVTLNNGNGILYVRSTPGSYVVKNNLFLNENGSNNLLGKASGVTVPSTMRGNFFYNCTSEKFFNDLFTQELATNGGGILSYNPVKNQEAGDYTLVDALLMSSNVGPARWNPNKGAITADFAASTVEELVNAISVGKTAVTLAYGTYDLTTVADGGVITLNAPMTLVGTSKGGVAPEIIGGFKLGAGTSSFVVKNLRFNGNEKALGNTFENAEAAEIDKIQITGCDIYGYNKSLYYGNGDSKVALFSFENNLVHGFGTGQGMLDIRKGAYETIDISKNTFYDGGRDFVRCDKEIAGNIAIRNNTFNACSIDAGNGLLWVRSCAGNPDRYIVTRNLFLNLTGDKTVLAKSGATVPTASSNYFFNVGGAFFGGAIDQAAATAGGGAVLEADPCANSAEGNFMLTNTELRNASVGDPRWNPMAQDTKKKSSK